MADLSSLSDNFFTVASETFTDNLSSSILAGATTVPVNSAVEYTEGDCVALTVNPGTNDEATFIGKKDSGNQFIECVWTEGNTGVGHDAGATIIDYDSASHHNAQTKGIKVEHNDDGTHNSAAAITIGKLLYPVGSIYVNATSSTNPATLLGFGTWTAYAAGRVLVGLDSGQTEFDTAEETGGAKTHTLTSSEMPSHSHGVGSTDAFFTGDNAGSLGRYSFQAYSSGTQRYTFAGDSTGDLQYQNNTNTAGSGGSHNNLQPYITVYMWKRTA